MDRELSNLRSMRRKINSRKNINRYLIIALTLSVIGAGMITYLHDPIAVVAICE